MEGGGNETGEREEEKEMKKEYLAEDSEREGRNDRGGG